MERIHNVNKKLPSLIWASLLLLAALAACGTNVVAPTGTLASTATTARSTPRATLTGTPPPSQDTRLEDLEGVEIEIWHPWPGETGEAFQAIVDDFNAANDYGITVAVSVQGSAIGLSSAMEAAIHDGGLPNLAVGHPSQYLAWDGEDDAIVGLSAYLADPLVGLDEEAAGDFYEVFWARDMIGGMRYALPALGTGQLIYYNLTWAAELGFTSPPSNPARFKAQACAAAQANGDGSGGWLFAPDTPSAAGWLFAFGSEFEVPGEGYNFNTPEAEEAFTFLKELYIEGCAWQQPQFYQLTDEFAARRALFYSASLSDLALQEAIFEESGNSDQWTVLPFPSPEGSPAIDVYGPSLVMLASTPEEQLAAWMFMRYFFEAETQAAWAEATGTFPLRASALDYMERYAADHPQWAEAVALLPYGRFEPRFVSWSRVRGALADAMTQLFRPSVTVEEIPALLETLEAFAAELHAEVGE